MRRRSPLQELLSAQPAVLIGLIAHLAGTPLQDDIPYAPRTACYDWAKTFSLHPRRGRQHPRLTAEPVVIDFETFCKIHDCRDRQGLSITQTARALGLHPQTVATWVARSRFEPRRNRPRSSVLDPFKPRIIRLLDNTRIALQQIFQRLREEGLSRWRDSSAGLRPLHPACQAAGLSQAALRSRRVCAGRLEMLYGMRCGGQYPSPAFVLRHGAGVQPPNVRGVHPLPDHGAFSSPATNTASPPWVCRPRSWSTISNPRFCNAWLAPRRCSIRAHLDFARHHGFAIEACNVARGNEKGRRESGVGYVKKHFCMGSS